MHSAKTFSPKEIAGIVGVSQSSIKRWVDAGLIEVTRTAGGHRRISLGEALRFIRKQEMQILRPDLLGLPDLENLPLETPPGELTGEVLLRVLESKEAPQARGLLTAAFLSGRKPAELFDGPIQAVMSVLGERWLEDQSGIYLEHQATQIIIQAIHEIQLLIPPPEPAAPVAVGCAPQHDPYLIPSMMAATVLADQGYHVVNLGAHTPAAALLTATEVHQAPLVWIAATSGHAFVDDLHEWEHVLTALQERGTQVVIGGQALQRLRITWPDGIAVMHSMAALSALGDTIRHEPLAEASERN